jgi:hypothetical protein
MYSYLEPIDLLLENHNLILMDTYVSLEYDLTNVFRREISESNFFYIYDEYVFNLLTLNKQSYKNTTLLNEQQDKIVTNKVMMLKHVLDSKYNYLEHRLTPIIFGYTHSPDSVNTNTCVIKICKLEYVH